MKKAKRRKVATKTAWQKAYEYSRANWPNDGHGPIYTAKDVQGAVQSAWLAGYRAAKREVTK